MTTKSNEEATGKKITKKDLMSLFFRSFLLPACYSMDRMQAPALPIPLSLYLKSCMGIIRKNYQRL